MTALGGCSSKQIVKKERYHNFSIYERPPSLHLKITSTEKILQDVHQILSKYPNLTRNDVSRAKVLIRKVMNDHSKIDAIKQLVTKIKMQDKLLDEYEAQIKDYQKWYDK